MDSFYVACQYASDEAAQLIMRRTMQARQREGIQWGMLAFLGDGKYLERSWMLFQPPSNIYFSSL